jgi:hypothetical protein
MTTLREKTEKAWEDGLDAARALVRQHLGHAGVYGDPGSLYAIDLTREARAIEVDLDGVRDRLAAYLSTRAVGPTGEERAAQRQLDLDDAMARQRAEERAAAIREELGVTPPRRDVEVVDVQVEQLPALPAHEEAVGPGTTEPVTLDPSGREGEVLGPDDTEAAIARIREVGAPAKRRSKRGRGEGKSVEEQG